MGKRLVLLFSLLALIFSVVSCQSGDDGDVQGSKEVENTVAQTEPDSLLAWMTHLKDESQVYRDQGDTQKAVEKLSQVIEQRWREPNTLEEYEKLAWIYTNRAYLYNERQGDFLAAKEDYLSALRQFESCEPSDFLVARYVYQPLGNIYTRLGENEIAISMLEKFKQVCESNGATEALMNAYNDIGRAHMNASKFEEAIEWFSKGIEIDQTDHFNIGLLYSSKAEAEEKNGDSQRAFRSAEKSIQNLDRLIQAADETDFHHVAANRYKIGVLGVLAKSTASTKGEQLAHPIYQEALKLAKKLYPDKHRGLARVYVNLGMSFAKIDNEIEALNCYQSGLNAILDEVDLDNFKQRFKKTELFADVVIGEALFEKAKTAHKLYKKEGDRDWLKTSGNTYLTYFDWVEIQRSEQFEFNSKLGTAGEIHQIGESALVAFFDLYKETNNPKWIDTAFILMDQTKAIVLAEERGYKNLAEKNPKLRSKLKQQNALKFQRSRFESDIKNLGEITQDKQEEVRRLKKRLSEIDKESQLLDQEIRRLFPSYRTKESSKLEGKGLTRLKNKLKEKKASIVSYFVGDRSVYVISGSPKAFRFKSFSSDALRQVTASFSSELIAPTTSTPEKYARAG
ncbi:MAG: tetratricopeptide repeat protein, partial [Crocinitomicaceae bacterium]